jgi:hypothetical protein
MTIAEAISVYHLKMRNSSHYVLESQSRLIGKSIAILKGEGGIRLACVVESKAGFTVDPVKKMHGMAASTRPGAPKRDSHGRFVKRT